MQDTDDAAHGCCRSAGRTAILIVKEPATSLRLPFPSQQGRVMAGIGPANHDLFSASDPRVGLELALVVFGDANSEDRLVTGLRQ